MVMSVPNAPTNFKSELQESGAVVLSWTAPSFEGGILDYQITHYDGSSYTTLSDIKANNYTFNYNDSQLYSFKV